MRGRIHDKTYMVERMEDGGFDASWQGTLPYSPIVRDDIPLRSNNDLILYLISIQVLQRPRFSHVQAAACVAASPAASTTTTRPTSCGHLRGRLT